MLCRGPDQWDWYILPNGTLEGVLGHGFEPWVEGVGAWRMCTLPSSTLAEKKVRGDVECGGDNSVGSY